MKKLLISLFLISTIYTKECNQAVLDKADENA